MNRKWFGIAALIIAAISLLSVSSCGDPQELVSITVSPATETVGASNIPVSADAGFFVQLTALGSYQHPPVTKDITNQVTWASNTPEMFGVNSTGLLTATGLACGSTLISATVVTNSDAGGVSSSGAIVTGNMTASVVCFTGSTGGSEPTLSVTFPGSGTGTVTSSPAGLNCSSTGPQSCIASFPSGTSITLTATPVGSVFVGWGGVCSGSLCTIDLESDTSVTATFN